MEKIEAFSVAKQLQQDFEELFPGWKMSRCGPDMSPGLRTEYGGKKNVFMTHPLNRSVGCSLKKAVDVPGGKKTVLRIVAAHDTRGDWTLVVKADGKEIAKNKIGPETADDGWVELEIDLSEMAGKSVELELVNQADDWRFEAAYWSEIAVESR